MAYKTEQESFWAGDFGDDYISRNSSQDLLASNLSFFSEILTRTQSINSILELGANIGLNLKALQALRPTAKIAAVEINKAAAEQLRSMKEVEVFHTSILEFEIARTYDLVFTKGVLIHINPEFLPLIYEKIYEASSRYICIAEYYSPSPVELPYRGFIGKLFKRDFAGEILDKYSGLRLVDYGFVYHRDLNFPQDDINWFLLEKA